jgi:hypothetical protein
MLTWHRQQSVSQETCLTLAILLCPFLYTRDATNGQFAVESFPRWQTVVLCIPLEVNVNFVRILCTRIIVRILLEKGLFRIASCSVSKVTETIGNPFQALAGFCFHSHVRKVVTCGMGSRGNKLSWHSTFFFSVAQKWKVRGSVPLCSVCALVA